MPRMVTRALAIMVWGALLGAVQPAWSVGPASPSHDGEKAAGPFYNPATKSYFELRRMTDIQRSVPHSTVWRQVRKLAESLSYGGVQGRLAVVPDLETHRFLLRHFRSDGDAWIGLRYECATQKLIWVDEREFGDQKFSAWDRQWYRNASIVCPASMEYMPVYYRARERGFTWQASGMEKGFMDYFVEYPTGGKIDPATGDIAKEESGDEAVARADESPE